MNKKSSDSESQNLSYPLKVIVAINFLKKCSVSESCFAKKGIYNTTFGLCESTYVSVNSKPYHLLPLPQQSHAWGPGFAHTNCAGDQDLMEVGKLENSTYRANSYSKSLFQYPYKV